MDTPTDNNLQHYIEVLRKKHVVAVVRACEPTYSKQPLLEAGIQVLDISFDDGSPPPEAMVTAFLNLITSIYGPPTTDKNNKDKEGKEKKVKLSTTNLENKEPEEDGEEHTSASCTKKTIAIHCVAGLGRAPVMVCIALIELGLKALDAIALVRKKRRGALNTRQLSFVQNYKPRNKAKSDCVIC